MLTQTAKYALHALIYLTQQPDDNYHQACRIAEQIKVPANYLGKTLQKLARARLVDSQKGLHGGFRSALLPEQVRIYDVLRAIDALPADMDAQCTCGADDMQELKCLCARFEKINALYENFLKETTLADLMADEIDVKPALVQTKPEKAAGEKQRSGFERNVMQVLSI
jgi:Rrf2 family protein